MTAPLDVEGSASQSQPEAVLAGVEAKRIQGRSLGQIAWMRLKRDKIAIAGGITILLLILIAIFAPLLSKLFGHPPNEFHDELIDPTFGTPKGRFGGISKEFPLGLEPVNGRDVFSRIVYGAQISLLIAFLATFLSVLIGTVFGVMAGFFGGWIDTAISSFMNVILAFPLLLFAIALVAVVPESFPRTLILVIVIGFFNWPYIGRIIRGQALSLREKEFIDASRSLGASNTHILAREMLPNLVGPILVYSTLIIPTNILFEAALSYLGVGVKPPTASWGSMLNKATQGWFQIDPMFMVVPGMALFITVLAFNLFGDGLRDALDPRSGR